jgi:hypothetical protein
MIQLTDPETTPLQQPLKRAARLRNLCTSAIVAIAFSGGPFGMTWLAASSATTFAVLMLWRLKQQQMISRFPLE